jgi:hypothetical protein
MNFYTFIKRNLIGTNFCTLASAKEADSLFKDSNSKIICPVFIKQNHLKKTPTPLPILAFSFFLVALLLGKTKTQAFPICLPTFWILNKIIFNNFEDNLIFSKALIAKKAKFKKLL